MITLIVPTIFNRCTIDRSIASSIMFPEISEVIIIIDDAAVQKGVVWKSLSNISRSLSIRVEYNYFDKGANGARLTGVKLSKNEWVAFLDDDDELLTGFRKSIAEAKQAHIHNNLIILGDYYYNECEIKIPRDYDSIPASVLNSFSLVPFSGLLVQKGNLLLKSLPTDLQSWQDDFLVINFIINGKYCTVFEPVARLHYTKESISSNKLIKLMGLRYVRSAYSQKIIESSFRRYLWKIREYILQIEIIGERSTIKGVRKLTQIWARLMRRILLIFFDRMGG